MPTPAALTSVLALIAGSAIGAPGSRDQNQIQNRIQNQRTIVDVSPDGHHRAERSLGAVRPGLAAAQGMATEEAPFGTTADYELEERRPIGGLAIADFNGDGFNDLAACAYTANSFPPYDDSRDFILFNTGSGLEATPSWFSANETHSADIQVGDINLDSYPDVVVVHGGGLRSDNARVYFGSPTGPSTSAGWTSSTSPSVWATDSLLVDIDVDGDLDLVSTNQGASSPNHMRPNFIFYNNAGTLETDPSWESSSYEISNGVAAGDIDGNGYPDLVFAKWVNYSSGLFVNPDGTPETSPYLTVGHTEADKGAAVGDIDGDSVLEIVFGGTPTTAYNADDLDFLDPFATTTPPFESISDVALEDVDLDGDDDLVEVHFADGRTHIYLNRDGVLDETPSWTYDAGEVGNAVAVGDLNNDGRPDLAVGYAGNVCIRVFYGEAPACIPDFTGDGTLDFFDLSAFLDALGAMDPIADLTGEGAFDFFDLSMFLSLFGEGCP